MQSRRPLRGAYGECAAYPKFAPYRLCACRKASDELKVPLCRIHHRLVHRVGNEAAWWSDAGVDSVKVARKLWKHIRVNEDVIRPGRFEPPLQNELWNQIFRRWRKRRSDSLTHLGACDGAFAPPPPTRGRLI
jgi:hypothetical protein